MVVEPRAFDLGLEPLADDVELALEAVGVGDPRPAADEGVEHRRLDRAALSPSELLSVSSGRQPRKICPSSATISLEERLAELLLRRRSGEREERADAVMLRARAASIPSGRHRETRNSCGIWIKQPRAVAGVVLAAAGAAMVQVVERRQAVADELVRFPPLQVDDEADAAAIVLVPRVVETLGWR